MILTVTFNPAIDKTAQVNQVQAGGLNRLSNVRQDAGGKGINVSRTLKALHQDSLATGFLGGYPGKFIEKSLHEQRIDTDFVWVDEDTRTNLKVLDGTMQLSEFNEAGPKINEAQLAMLEEKILAHCDNKSIVILSGNVSPGVNKEIYQVLTQKVHEKGGRVILDADGALFREGLVAQPDVIKPNRYELAQYFGIPEETALDELIEKARTLLNEKTQLIVLSMGAQGSVFITKETVYIADALKITYHSSVGAGDAMVACLAYGLEHHLPLEELLVLAVACSAGACMSQGTSPAPYEVVERLKEKVVYRKWE